MRRAMWESLRMADVAGELSVGEVFLPGFVEAHWYPYGWAPGRAWVVRACDVRVLARRLSEAHGGKVVAVWFTRQRLRGVTGPRLYLVGKVRRLDGSTEGAQEGMRPQLGADWGAIGTEDGELEHSEGGKR